VKVLTVKYDHHHTTKVCPQRLTIIISNSVIAERLINALTEGRDPPTELRGKQPGAPPPLLEYQGFDVRPTGSPFL
jgi:hypothetical protein